MTTNDIVEFFYKHYQWVFSGVGVFILALFFQSKSSSSNKVNQKNISAGGDVTGRDKK